MKRHKEFDDVIAEIYVTGNAGNVGSTRIQLQEALTGKDETLKSALAEVAMLREQNDSLRKEIVSLKDEKKSMIEEVERCREYPYSNHLP